MFTAEMASKLDQLFDRDQIRHVLGRYCRGQDRQDEATLLSAYWPDGWDDHGMVEGTPAEFVANVAAQWPSLRMEHMIGEPYIELHGNFANSETYFFNHNKLSTGQDTVDTLIGGRYNDRLEKRGDEWRILYRTVVYDWYKVLGPTSPWDDSVYPFAAMPSRSYGDTARDFTWELFSDAKIKSSTEYPRGSRK